ncbi:MAG: DUF1573 domain-containing protein [Actinobacteria bacterium]|nr:MAG: DUF1573 domain-containing protein [Actinomycetota bacterium]
MKKKEAQELQEAVSHFLVRNRSILDVMAKFAESNAKVNSAIVKSVTHCGCLEIDASKQPIPEGTSIAEMLSYVQSHIKGKLCDNCRQILEEDIGNSLFYLTGICALLDLDLEEIMKSENSAISTLGVYSLT